MSAGRLLHVILVICFWAAVIAVFVWLRARERRLSREQKIARKSFDDRLLRPDWNFYERHLGRPAPRALRELFADAVLVTSCNLVYNKSYITTFCPLDKENVPDSAGLLRHDIVPFAMNDYGDAVYLRPGATEPDTVYIAYHEDPGKVETFAESVTVMLERLRKENR